jgi:cytochrome c biogenesis factor
MVESLPELYRIAYFYGGVAGCFLHWACQHSGHSAWHAFTGETHESSFGCADPYVFPRIAMAVAVFLYTFGA